MDIAAWYRRFARHEARGSSPRYERLAETVAASDELLDWLSQVPAAKRQPNLFFASARFLGCQLDGAAEFIDFVRTNSERLVATMTSRSTQTNEPARCAAFVPLLAGLDTEIALIEVGASAGLCLFPDRYAYTYDGVQVGDSTVVFDVETNHTIRAPRRLPTVAWRAGLDLNPLDAADPDDLAWLRACIWPEHDERRRRFDLAAAIVADDPPRIDRGDLLTGTLALIDQAPQDAIKVVFHSAVLAYVDRVGRDAFEATMRHVVDDRDDLLWLSNEASTVVTGIQDASETTHRSRESARFLLGRNGNELVAVTDPHGRWIEWVR